ncbi:MAG: metallophosphoesterase [Spirobacillus cienkowskii]|jgi:predicted MPP superfamily phosphohydrolase|uniref:Metallophosphoesterase n=1 Tax=Spirobacillus cienkowskii TaxID=495820 RepID=A0A369KT70_9BACT|nr:MAG: metallophosphoesterase [Spirobacillus cienkowskii]
MDFFRVIVIIALFVFSYFYISRFLLIIFNNKKKKLIYLLLLLFFLLINFSFWGSFFYRNTYRSIPEYFIIFQWIGYCLLGVWLFSLTCFFITDFIFLIKKILNTLLIKFNVIKLKTEVDYKKRNFLHFISLGSVFILSGISFYNARKIPNVKKIFIPIGNLHQDLRNFNIVQLTDFHIGQTIGLEYVQNVVAAVNALNPDLIVITGDLVDGFVHQLQKETAPLAQLKAKYGVYYVTGNHEYYWDGPGWIAYMQSIGAMYLGNANKTIKVGRAHIVIAGLTDLQAERFYPEHKTDYKKSIEGVPAMADLKILLAHQPNSAFEAAKLNYFDLQISGHTHGGQMWPGTWLVNLIQYFKPGLTQYENMQVYVSRGTGYWGPPARLGAESEITHIYFKQA